MFPYFTDRDAGGSENLENFLKFTWIVRGGARVLNQSECKSLSTAKNILPVNIGKSVRWNT